MLIEKDEFGFGFVMTVISMSLPWREGTKERRFQPVSKAGRVQRQRFYCVCVPGVCRWVQG